MEIHRSGKPQRGKPWSQGNEMELKIIILSSIATFKFVIFSVHLYTPIYGFTRRPLLSYVGE